MNLEAPFAELIAIAERFAAAAVLVDAVAVID
jgi:hypothetical protein